MFEIAWPELLLVVAVALVAIGPKDLPKVLHTCGLWAGKARRAWLSIQHDMERLAHEAETAEKTKTQKSDTNHKETKS